LRIFFWEKAWKIDKEDGSRGVKKGQRRESSKKRSIAWSSFESPDG
jgi:hypothetical protein